MDLVVSIDNGNTIIFSEKEVMDKLYGWFLNEESETKYVDKDGSFYIFKRSKICYMILRKRDKPPHL